MLAASIGRMPTALVIILMLSLCASLISGTIIHIASQSHPAASEFMPVRLESSPSAPSPNIKLLQGHWVVQTSNYAMSLTLVDDRFEWILRLADIADVQFYARGNFRIKGDVMILGVRPDLGKPYDIQKPWIKYMPIAMKDLNIRISVDKDHMMWTVPASEQARILAQTATIFNDNNDGRFTWVRR